MLTSTLTKEGFRIIWREKPLIAREFWKNVTLPLVLSVYFSFGPVGAIPVYLTQPLSTKGVFRTTLRETKEPKKVVLTFHWKYVMPRHLHVRQLRKTLKSRGGPYMHAPHTGWPWNVVYRGAQTTFEAKWCITWFLPILCQIFVHPHTPRSYI